MPIGKAKTDSYTVVSISSKAEPDSDTVVSNCMACDAHIPAREARDIRAGERFEPMPQFDVLLSSPHRNYLTKANHAYIELKPSRSKQLNVEQEVRGPLRTLLQREFGRPAPEPIFWIGTDKVRSEDEWKPGTMKTFAIGRRLRKCYTVVMATDRGIIEENYRNGKGAKRRDTKDAAEQQDNNEASSEKSVDSNESVVFVGSSAPLDFSAETEATVLPVGGRQSNENSIMEADPFPMEDPSSSQSQQHFAPDKPSDGILSAPLDPSDNRQDDYEPLDETTEDHVEIQTEEMEFEPLDAKMSSYGADSSDAVASTGFDPEPAELTETNDFEPYPLQYQDRASFPTWQTRELDSPRPCSDNIDFPQRVRLRRDAAFGRQFHHLGGESSLYSGASGGLSIQSHTSQSHTSQLSAMSDPVADLDFCHNDIQTKRFSTQSDCTNDRTQNPMLSMFSGFGRSTMQYLRHHLRSNTDDDDMKMRGDTPRTGSIKSLEEDSAR